MDRYPDTSIKGRKVLKKPKNKKELMRLLQEADDFNVLTIEYGKSKDLAESVRKLHSTKQLAVVVIELR
jgi:hypothetical protein